MSLGSSNVREIPKAIQNVNDAPYDFRVMGERICLWGRINSEIHIARTLQPSRIIRRNRKTRNI
jgi:hypothetical protein